MEATSKEKFYREIAMRFHSMRFYTYTFPLYLILRKYSTENENFSQKTITKDPFLKAFPSGGRLSISLLYDTRKIPFVLPLPARFISEKAKRAESMKTFCPLILDINQCIRW